MFLRGEEARPRQLDFLHIRPLSRAFAAFIHGADSFITWLSKTYARVIHVSLQLRYLLLLVFLCGLGATVWTYQRVPTGFIPQEDQGYLIGIVQAPPGSSLAYTSALAERAQGIIYSNKDVAGAFSIMQALCSSAPGLPINGAPKATLPRILWRTFLPNSFHSCSLPTVD
jgi:HAE1 family hydrophobic/amphiphilic exporter-1